MERLRSGWGPVAVALVLGVTVLGIQDAPALPSPTAPFDHRVWERLLRENVDEEGRVAYRCLAAEGRADLGHYLDELAGAVPGQMSEKEQLAFWINAYNAGIVAAIVQKYSPETALSRLQLFRWYTFAVAGKKRTPDEIEHEILRQSFKEPRIHFALVCAASSCPRLRREAYTGERLDEQLDDQARRFINDPNRNVVDVAHARVQLSSLFDWFGSDFAAAEGSVAGFVARYVSPEQAELLRGREVQIEYLPYDWALNAQKGQRVSGVASVGAPSGHRSDCRRKEPGPS